MNFDRNRNRFRLILWIYFFIFSVVTCQPYVSIDWSTNSVDLGGSKIDAYTVDYFPNVGKPLPPIRLPSFTMQTEISDTLPATMYTVAVIAEFQNGQRSIIFNTSLPSSPEPPLVDTIDSRENEIDIQLFPSEFDDVTYLTNYSLVTNLDQQFSQTSNQPRIVLKNLLAGSEYEIFIFTIFNRIYSHRPCHLTMKTLSAITKNFDHTASLVVSSATSPSLAMETENMVTTTISMTTSVNIEETSEIFFNETDQFGSSPYLETSTIISTITFDRTDQPPVLNRSISQPLIQSKIENGRKLGDRPIAEEAIEEKSNISTIDHSPKLILESRDEELGEDEDVEVEGEEGGPPLSKAIPNRKGHAKVIVKNHNKDASLPKPSHITYNFTSSLPSDIMAKLPDSYGRPRSLEFSPEGRQLRLSWLSPQGTDCSGYLINYTLITLHVPKTFQLYVDGGRLYTFIKMFFNNVIQVEIFCIANETIVSKTPGRITVDLKKPEPIRNLTIANILTDDFFRSSILLDWFWPNGSNFDLYSVVISYFPGKAKKLKSQTLMVNETGPVNISGLKPTETYTFTIKNISRLNIESATTGFKQIMPPVIASTLLPGQVTSTSLLITYSPTDVDEARFDSYQMVACFSETVNKTLVKSKSDPNRNFLLKNLIPGQTYSFYLYTVYRKVRSKAVAANFTTYPLKVKNLFGIVRRNAVKLFYEPEESILKEIRYKLGFTGSDGSESDSVTLLNQREYVFDYLKPEIWYTFSVTVLMGDQESESNARTIVTGFNSDPVPHLRGSTTTTIDIAFRRDVFTESNGIIQNYSIIIAEDYRMDYYNYSVLSWRAVQNHEVWPPYRATPADYHPFKNPNDEAITYTIGIETCHLDGQDEYCNGPLKPRTEYFIKLRACTNEYICMETSYTKAATEIDTSSLETRRFLNPRYGASGCPTFKDHLSLLLTFFSTVLYFYKFFCNF